MVDTLRTFAIGFAGCYIAIATHVTFNSLYTCIFSSSVIARARVGIGAMFLLTSLANFLQYLPIGDLGCLFTAKLSIASFHIQMLSGEAFQMYRISVIAGSNRIFASLAIPLLILRATVMVSDVVVSTSYADSQDSCVFVQELYSGVVHVAMDAIVELFITTAISMALFQHTQDLKRLSRGSRNISLYKIIIETNIFRTIILFLVNLTTMLIIMNDPHSIVLTYMWSLMGIVYLYFVIYDKGMVRFLHLIANTPSRHTAAREENPFSSMTPLQQPIPNLISLPVTVDEWAGQYLAHHDAPGAPKQQLVSIDVIS
ncbi:hypothetical protein DSO57_1025818 [Entomophthora muscae]|uniref:Uncharacterized protein n=1 Tax=Entomophthora muscae TaxID=34485 RepID=A0ACC2UC20_9FUNG|nr:hypothetical protein DSO57_1025818 [Entomophthora muscae]